MSYKKFFSDPNKLFPMPSNRSGNCNKCGRGYKKNEQIFWSRSGGAVCVHCGRGRDPAAVVLTDTQRLEMQGYLDTIKRLEHLPAPLRPERQQELDEALLALTAQFGQIAKVKDAITGHTNRLMHLIQEGVASNQGNDLPSSLISAAVHTQGALKQAAGKAPDLTIQGLLWALEGERQPSTLTSCQIAGVRQREERFLITLKPGCSDKLVEVQEGWHVSGQKRAKSDAYPWVAEIIDIDNRDPVHLSVSRFAGDEAPKVGETMFFYRPDYQKIIRDWAAKRIAQQKGLPSAYAELARDPVVFSRELEPAVETVPNPALRLRTAQQRAVHLINRKLGIVWGPPGTGKTYTLGAAVSMMMMEGRKVLLLAPTNSAADLAALAVDDAMSRLGKELTLGELIRPGHPSLPQIEARPHLLAWSERQKEMTREIEKIMDERGKLEKERQKADEKLRLELSDRIARLKEQEQKLKDARSRELWQLAHNAKVVVTTLHSAICNDTVLGALANQTLSLVIDEASMVPRYMLARIMDSNVRQVLLFGDFKQLGPIRQNEDDTDENSKYWVGDSAFEVCWLRGDKDFAQLERLSIIVMLDEQSRMHEQICDSVSRLFYNGRLSAVGTPPRVPLTTWLPHHSILLIGPGAFRGLLRTDTDVRRLFDASDSTLKNVCLFSAIGAVSLAREVIHAEPNCNILLLSPFRNQAHELKRMGNALLPNGSSWKAGTVHISQGQEADLVLFCPVKPGHRWFSGADGRRDLERLLCVAMSRARSHVIVFADRNELQANPLLWDMSTDAHDWRPDLTRAR